VTITVSQCSNRNCLVMLHIHKIHRAVPLELTENNEHSCRLQNPPVKELNVNVTDKKAHKK
jgi:hypothetical protein